MPEQMGIRCYLMGDVVKKRIAKSGKRVADGRAMPRKWLEQAADNYSRDIYAADLFLEHIRGVLPDSPFRVYGNVMALSIEDAGKGEVYLVADIKPSKELKSWWADGQKRAFSVEIIEDFADMHSAYLVGVGVTDSPGSLGTSFTQRFTFDPDANGHSVNITAFGAQKTLGNPMETEQFTNSLKHFSAEIEAVRTERDMFKNELAAQKQQFNADFSAKQEELNTLKQQFAADLLASEQKYTADMAAKEAEIEALKEKIPADKFNFRPLTTGAEGGADGGFIC